MSLTLIYSSCMLNFDGTLLALLYNTYVFIVMHSDATGLTDISALARVCHGARSALVEI